MIGELPEIGEAPLVSPILEADKEVEFDYTTCMCTIGDANVTVEAIYMGEAEEKHLVIFPKSVWHKTPSKRVLPPGTIIKPMALQVDGAAVSAREERLVDHPIRIWMGFVEQGFLESLEEVGSKEARDALDFAFCSLEDSGFLPHVQALATLAVEHFNFVSAESAADPVEPVEDVAKAAGVDASQDLFQRMNLLEDAMVRISSSLEAMAAQGQPSTSPPRMSPPAAPAKKKKLRVQIADVPWEIPVSSGGLPTARAKSVPSRQRGSVKDGVQSAPVTSMGATANKYPSLDPSVVSAAVAAGVEASALEDMERMMGKGASGTRRLREPAIRKTPASAATLHSSAVLSESEDEEDEEDEEPGSGPQPSGGVDAALGKLADILSLLTQEKVKKQKSSKVDLALDAASGPSTSEGSHGGGLKRAAAARRALRQALVEHPEDISAMVEKLMYEDLTSQVLPPGVPPAQLSARAWIEHRSRIGAYRTAAHTAWCAGGILDDLLAGRVAHARARAGLLILQLDQTAIDRGSWTFAGELALEQGPPMAALGNHTLPALG